MATEIAWLVEILGNITSYFKPSLFRKCFPSSLHSLRISDASFFDYCDRSDAAAASFLWRTRYLQLNHQVLSVPAAAASIPPSLLWPINCIAGLFVKHGIGIAIRYKALDKSVLFVGLGWWDVLGSRVGYCGGGFCCCWGVYIFFYVYIYIQKNRHKNFFFFYFFK